MTSLHESDEIEITQQNWNKLENTATKSGYRDGISDGRESNFQGGFDEGYRVGFQNGFALGKYKGAISLNKEISEEMLQKVSRGNCEVCKNKSIENNPIPELIEIQTESTNAVLKQMFIKYNQTLNVALPHKLN